MKDQQINDQVFASAGKPIYESVYGFGHHETTTSSECIQIHTNSKHPSSSTPLEMSASQLFYVQDKPHPVRGDTIQKGDVLIQKTIQESTSSNLVVTNVETVMRKGAYMPLTKTGSIVVSGILASNYCTS